MPTYKKTILENPVIVKEYAQMIRFSLCILVRIYLKRESIISPQSSGEATVIISTSKRVTDMILTTCIYTL